MDFAELLAALQNPGDEGLSPTVYDDLSIVYGDDVGSRDAKIEELNAGIQAREAEISRLKVLNYDLLMSSPGEVPADDNESDNDSTPDSGVDSLFD